MLNGEPGGNVRDRKLKTLSAESGGYYRKPAGYGHMGRTNPEVPWESTALADKLK